MRPVNTATDTQRDYYYSHDAEAPSKHTQSQLDEFGGVSNRHSSCADCHNSPHRAKVAPDSTQTTKGWDASGSLAGVSGVSAVNGTGRLTAHVHVPGRRHPAGHPRIPALLQVPLRVHEALAPIAGKPSTDELDKGVEFNPNNPSFHPVEAAGTNQTPKMDSTSRGTSPDKLWNFNVGSTIRCLNCHASSATPGTAPLPLPGSALAPHTSSNRGILLRTT